MPTTTRPRWRAEILAAIGVAIWLIASLAAVYSINLGLPTALEQVLTVLAVPGLFALTVSNPILRPIGLTTGEWWTLPSPAGCLLVIVTYCSLAYFLVQLFRLFRRR